MAQKDEWTEVVNDQEFGTKIIFDTIGDEFIGLYKGSTLMHGEDGDYYVYRFTGDDGEPYFMNGNYSLSSLMSKVRAGVMCRISYVEDRDTGQASPMRVFQVATRRP